MALKPSAKECNEQNWVESVKRSEPERHGHGEVHFCQDTLSPSDRERCGDRTTTGKCEKRNGTVQNV